MLAFLVLALGAMTRLIIHAPNFTPVLALALFGGVYLKKKQALVLPVILLAATDIILGYHQTIFFTWGCIVLIAAMGIWVKNNKNTKTIFGSSLLAAVVYYIVTNLGVWLTTGMYPMNLSGLAECYYVAIPYFRNTLISTFAYTFLLFTAYDLIAARIKNTRFAYLATAPTPPEK